jgi:hypothetical protein
MPKIDEMKMEMLCGKLEIDYDWLKASSECWKLAVQLLLQAGFDSNEIENMFEMLTKNKSDKHRKEGFVSYLEEYGRYPHIWFYSLSDSLSNGNKEENKEFSLKIENVMKQSSAGFAKDIVCYIEEHGVFPYYQKDGDINHNDYDILNHPVVNYQILFLTSKGIIESEKIEKKEVFLSRIDSRFGWFFTNLLEKESDDSTNNDEKWLCENCDINEIEQYPFFVKIAVLFAKNTTDAQSKAINLLREDLDSMFKKCGKILQKYCKNISESEAIKLLRENMDIFYDLYDYYNGKRILQRFYEDISKKEIPDENISDEDSKAIRQLYEISYFMSKYCEKILQKYCKNISESEVIKLLCENLDFMFESGGKILQKYCEDISDENIEYAIRKAGAKFLVIAEDTRNENVNSFIKSQIGFPLFPPENDDLEYINFLLNVEVKKIGSAYYKNIDVSDIKKMIYKSIAGMIDEINWRSKRAFWKSINERAKDKHSSATKEETKEEKDKCSSILEGKGKDKDDFVDRILDISIVFPESIPMNKELKLITVYKKIDLLLKIGTKKALTSAWDIISEHCKTVKCNGTIGHQKCSDIIGNLYRSIFDKWGERFPIKLLRKAIEEQDEICIKTVIERAPDCSKKRAIFSLGNFGIREKSARFLLANIDKIKNQNLADELLKKVKKWRDYDRDAGERERYKVIIELNDNKFVLPEYKHYILFEKRGNYVSMNSLSEWLLWSGGKIIERPLLLTKYYDTGMMNISNSKFLREEGIDREFKTAKEFWQYVKEKEGEKYFNKKEFSELNLPIEPEYEKYLLSKIGDSFYSGIESGDFHEYRVYLNENRKKNIRKLLKNKLISEDEFQKLETLFQEEGYNYYYGLPDKEIKKCFEKDKNVEEMDLIHSTLESEIMPRVFKKSIEWVVKCRDDILWEKAPYMWMRIFTNSYADRPKIWAKYLIEILEECPPDNHSTILRIVFALGHLRELLGGKVPLTLEKIAKEQSDKKIKRQIVLHKNFLASTKEEQDDSNIEQKITETKEKQDDNNIEQKITEQRELYHRENINMQRNKSSFERVEKCRNELIKGQNKEMEKIIEKEC